MYAVLRRCFPARAMQKKDHMAATLASKTLELADRALCHRDGRLVLLTCGSYCHSIEPQHEQIYQEIEQRPHRRTYP